MDVAGKQQKILGNALYYDLPVLVVLMTAVGWILFSDSRPEPIPAPADVWAHFVKILTKPTAKTSLTGHVWASLGCVLAVLLIAQTFGISFGALVGQNKECGALFGSVFEVIRPIPPITWIPIVVMWFGINEFPKVLLVSIKTFMSLIIDTSARVEMVGKVNLDVGYIFDGNNRQILTDIVVPTALPSIFAEIHASISSSWATALAAEMLGARKGLGALMTRGWRGDDMALVPVSVIAIAAVGAPLSLGLQRLEKVVCPRNS